MDISRLKRAASIVEEKGAIQKGLLPDSWLVESQSNGGQYKVEKVGGKWRCECADSRRGNQCKHILAVQSLIGEINLKAEMKRLKGNFSTSLLKSALQKAIRRHSIEKAVKIAKKLIQQNEVEFLRRILVIMVEDVLPHPDSGVIIGLMKKSRKEGLDSKDRDFLLNFTADLANCRERLFAEYYELIPKWKEIRKNKGIATRKYEELSGEEKRIVGAILYRSKMGGMAGDIEMLQDTADEVAEKFLKGEWTIEKLREKFKRAEEIKWDEVGELRKEDIPLEAVDGHISPINKILLKKGKVVEFIERNKIEDAETMLDWTIWIFRGAVNYRKEVDWGREINWLEDFEILIEPIERQKALIPKLWEVVKEEVDRISRWWIER